MRDKNNIAQVEGCTYEDSGHTLDVVRTLKGPMVESHKQNWYEVHECRLSGAE